MLRLMVRFYSINYLTNSLPKTLTTPLSQFPKNHINRNVKPSRQPQKPGDLISAKALTLKYRDLNIFPLENGKLMGIAQKFFSHCNVKLEWTLLDYNKVPGPQDPKYVPLPEVLFLGNTNSGKSTMINAVLPQIPPNSRLSEYARVSSRDGFTKTMNCFNVGNKFRLVDSPGYGKYGEINQGKMVLEYLENRKALRHVLILIDATRGFVEDDVTMINHLTQRGISFEILLTKVDLVIQRYVNKHRVKSKLEDVKLCNKDIEKYFDSMFDNIGLFTLGIPINLTFLNNEKQNWIRQLYGYKQVRCSIIEATGILEML